MMGRQRKVQNKLTDHARLDSVKRYAKTELARKRELMERKVIRLEERRGRFGVES